MRNNENEPRFMVGLRNAKDILLQIRKKKAI